MSSKIAYSSDYFTTETEEFVICSICESKFSPKSIKSHSVKCELLSKIRKIRFNRKNNNRHKQTEANQSEKQSRADNCIQLLELGPETIPCTFCGYNQTLKELDTHLDECQYQQTECPFCNTLYPLNLVEEHMELCEEQALEKVPKDGGEKEQDVSLATNSEGSFTVLINKKIGRDADNCQICYKPYHWKEEYISFKCGHSFHGFCIDPWLQQNDHCLLCKKVSLEQEQQ